MNSNEKRTKRAEYMRNYRKRKREKQRGEAANQSPHTADGYQVQRTEDETIHRAEEAQRKRKFRHVQRQQETEVEIHEETLAVEGRSVPTVSMAFSRDRNLDRKRYNLPTVDEIAMIFRSADGAPPFERDFRIYPRDPAHPLITLNILSHHLDPMTYVLFFPYGEPGWQPDIPINLQNRPNRRRIRVTMLQWKIAQTAVRINHFNPILNGGKLFQQWAVDSYAQFWSRSSICVHN